MLSRFLHSLGGATSRISHNEGHGPPGERRTNLIIFGPAVVQKVICAYLAIGGASMKRHKRLILYQATGATSPPTFQWIGED